MTARRAVSDENVTAAGRNVAHQGPKLAGQGLGVCSGVWGFRVYKGLIRGQNEGLGVYSGGLEV